MNEYDVVIRMSEPRYWVLLAGSLLAGWALIRRFQSIDEVGKDRALKQLGGVLLLLQVGYQGWMLFDETFDWTIHRSLPLHFCGINIWLVALNCFWRNPTVYLFTAFMGTIGGAHAILTPQLTVGDDMPILIHYYINHASLVVVPLIMTFKYGMRFPKWGWMFGYAMAAGLSIVMIGINQLLNTCCPAEVLANYMYMTEPPKADNPFVFRELGWPWYILPLHAALILHLIVLNALYRWRFPVPDSHGLRWWN